ncbi:hypothetical protein AAC387_Pa07g0276 [Persea americana]
MRHYRRIHQQYVRLMPVFLLSERTKTGNCNITAEYISGNPANSVFLPSQRRKTCSFNSPAYSSGGKPARLPNLFQARRSVSFNIKLATH